MVKISDQSGADGPPATRWRQNVSVAQKSALLPKSLICVKLTKFLEIERTLKHIKETQLK